MAKFQGKVVWITGASSGIGEELAYIFHREGARLILSGRRVNELQRVRDNAIRRHGAEGDIVVLALDLDNLDEPTKKGVEALAAFGRIDILVNNAGIGQYSAAIETDISTVEKIMRVNYLGQVAVTKAVLPSMIKNRSGHIVVVSSVTGKFGVPMRSAYAASKHALHGFFDSLRAEVWRFRIKVTLVCPGYIRTGLRASALQGDGTPRGNKAAAHGNALSAEACAESIVQAVVKGKEEIYIGRQKFAVYASRLFPGLVSQFLRRSKFS